MLKVVITGHHGLGNRGCEALLRSTVHMVRSRYAGARFWVPSSRPESDARQWPDAPAHGVEFVPAPRSSAMMRAWAHVADWWPSVAAGPWPLVEPPPPWPHIFRQCDLMLSIGGDNYTLDYGLESLAFHRGLGEWAMSRGCPVVLWGASIGPFERGHGSRPWIPRAMGRHLSSMHAITVRESLSASILDDLLNEASLGRPAQEPPRVAMLADPAFTLKPEPTDLEPHWPSGSAPVLGLNISPLVLTRHEHAPSAETEGEKPLGLEGLATFIRRRCESGEYRVLLVPHVSARNAVGEPVHAVSPASDDDRLLDELMRRLQGVNGLARIPVWDAPRIKAAISQCDLFIGARTHSVVAALSSHVPAVALAYSTKARGIHRDLFGHEDGVVQAGALTLNNMDHALDHLQRRAPLEKSRLLTLIPHWQTRARHAVDFLPSGSSIAPESTPTHPAA